MNMKTILIIPAMALAIAFQSCAQSKGRDKTTMKNANDSLAYAIGVGIGQSLMKQGLEDLNYEIMKQAMLDQFDNKSKMEDKAADAYMRKRLKVRMDEKAEKNKVAGEKWLADNMKKEGVKQTSSGLQYKIIREGQGEHPGEVDEVTVHYRGTLTDGRQFDSSYDRGEPSTFRLNMVIKGWQEGLQLMKPGASFVFYIPQHLAYGANAPQGSIIEPYAPLVFEVELFSAKR
jgi:FKBP-type peptidyl-prolyl cis-trans isomerase FkpA